MMPKCVRVGLGWNRTMERPETHDGPVVHKSDKNRGHSTDGKKDFVIGGIMDK